MGNAIESEKQFSEKIEKNRNIFEKKNVDYGCSWTALRYSTSFTDQIFIKAQRIRTIQVTKQNLVGEPIENEFVGMFNYAIMALIKQAHDSEFTIKTPIKKLLEWFDEQVVIIEKLRAKKNHDYGEAWRDMRVSSITDLILMKLLRIKQIEDNSGATLVSEPIDAGFHDIANYSLFALVLIEERLV